jgi:hypothetical protein
MEPQVTSKVATVSITSVAIDGMADLPCRACGAVLDVCQPDPNLPDRFLATCPDCLTWFLVETSSDQSTAWIASLAPLVGLARPWDLRPTSP